MSFLPRLPRLLGFVVCLAALGYLIVLTSARLRRSDAVTDQVQTEVTVDPTSPTGYAAGLRNRVIPEHNNESVQWIVQTQEMLAPKGPWRIREVRYDNAPAGRTILTPSPYRWWLGLLAQARHLLSGRPLGLSTEFAARFADPLLLVLLLAVAVVLVGRRFGIGPACLLSIALVTLFPFGGAFVPAQPTDSSLMLVLLATSVLLLIVGADQRAGVEPPIDGRCESPANRSRIGWFLAAGVVLGIGFWVDAARALPVLVGIGGGGFLAGWWSRRALQSGAAPALLPWRHWAVAGATTTLLAYLLEYYPDSLGSLYLREVHPLYGVAWLGLGELLARLSPSTSSSVSRRKGRAWAAIVLALLAVAAVPVALVIEKKRDLFTVDPATACLTNLGGSPIAQSLWAWLVHDGVTLTLVATCLPLLLPAAAVALMFSKRTDWNSRALLALSLGPTLATAALACFQLRSWNEFDAMLAALIVAIAVTAISVFESRLLRPAWLGVILLALAPGAIVLTNKAVADRHDPISGTEVQSLLERDLAHWLSRQAGPEGAVVLAPPNLTASLIYYGGLSGLGTPYWENKAGFNAAMRIAGASSPDEAQAVATGRNLGYIVMPSWDNFLEEYARQGAADLQHTLIAYLERWLPPRWLRPIPYHLPKIAGFEGQSVAIFKVVEVQDNATALSNLAEYFVEMDMPAQAEAVAHALEQSYPADLGASVARALVARAAEDAPAFTQAFKDIQASLDRGEGDDLTWDRRVSLAVALVDGRRLDQAKEEVKRCLAEIDEGHLRSLTTVTLHRLLVMTRSFGLKIDKPSLSLLAQQLLPPELREHP